MYYASIGGVRIQTWIAQSATKLSLVRGASILLKEQTSMAETTRWLNQGHPGVEVDADAGDIDGVVVLKSSDKEKLHQAARGLVRHLERQVPGLAWEGWICDGDTYLDAYARHAGGPPSMVSLPPLPELGLVEACGYCGVEPAVKPLKIGDESQAAGPSCITRRRARDGQDRQVRDHRLWADIPGEWPDDFEHLARHGGNLGETIGRKDSRSHLATVAADGNGIGALFLLVNRFGLPGLRQTAVKLLNDATTAAVVAAAIDCGSDTQTKVVIPHYVGGDDVFASVAAPAVWRFATRLGREFEKFKAELNRHVPDGSASDELREAINRLGLGIGIALARRSTPISVTSVAAHTALGAAKAATNGGASAIGWVDLTADAASIYSEEIGAVEADLEDLNPVFRLPASARAALAAVVRSAPIDPTPAVQAWATRTGNTVPEGMLPTLSKTLSRARWWPDLPEEN